MAEALSEQVDSLTFLTAAGIRLPLSAPNVDLTEWYGLRRHFRIVGLPVHLSLSGSLFHGYRYPLFDLAAAFYSKIKSPDLVYTRSPYAGYLCVRLGLDTIIETHINQNHPEFRRVLDASLMPHFRGLVTVTDFLKDTYARAGVRESKIFVWPDAVDLRWFNNFPSQRILRKQLKLPAEEKIATYCGHFYQHKGISNVISAAKYLPDIFFCLVGGWPRDIERCRKQAKGLKNVYFTGFVPYQQVPDYLSASDFLLLPNSMKHEQAYSTSPLKLFEYMASRRPIIASNIPAFKGILNNEGNACLIEPDSPVDIASAIRTLISNTDLSSKIVDKAWQDVQHYTWKRRSRDILNHFKVNVE